MFKDFPQVFLTHFEPNTANEALAIPHWKAAMQAEHTAHINNNTWSLVPLPAKRTVLLQMGFSG